MTGDLLHNEIDNSKYLGYAEASAQLGTCAATLRNWVKAGYIFPLKGTGRKVLFLKEDISVLKNKLTECNTGKLQSRANKINVAVSYIPGELFLDTHHHAVFRAFISELKEWNLPLTSILYLYSLQHLERSGLLRIVRGGLRFKNENIKKVMTEWLPLSAIDLALYHSLPVFPHAIKGDIIGVLYQSLRPDGDKSISGSYYTPMAVADSIAADAARYIRKDSLVLDPCSGTGQFLRAFAKYISDPTLLYGYDIDVTAVHIARINLLLEYSHADFFPNIYYKNTLQANDTKKFDIIATNPPWGYHFTQKAFMELQSAFPALHSKEAFSYFLLQGIHQLNENGYLAYVLPESILTVKYHEDIRKYLLANTTIKSIKHISNPFTRVFSKAIILTLEKKKRSNGTVRVIKENGEIYAIRYNRFSTNKGHIIDTLLTEKDKEVIDKIYKRKYMTLRTNASWALGIVTGNNKQYISSSKTEANKPILKGTDIKKFGIKEPSAFITLETEKFQQMAPLWKYEVKEKLIYKFISNTLMFAYDDKKMLTLNSANILIPRLPSYPIKLVLAVCNSAVFQFLYKKKFNSIKVLRTYLEELPFPYCHEHTANRIIGLTDKLIAGDISAAERILHISELDALIFTLYGLQRSEVSYIQSAVNR